MTRSKLLFAVGLLATACGRKAEAPRAEAPPVHVRTTSVAVAPMPKLLRLTGSLTGDREAQLAAGASGRVIQSLLERGREVRAGEALVVVDTRAQTLGAREAKAQADLAQAQAEIAKRECERFSALRERGAITQLEYDRATDSCRTTKLTVGAASARAELAEQNVNDGVVRAPFSGVIDERYVEVGEFLRADSRVARLVVVDLLRLRFALPETHVAAVQVGDELDFTVSAFPGERFSARVRSVSPALREATRDLVVEASVANASRRLKPGMFAELELDVGRAPSPAVPEGAVMERDGVPRVFVVARGRVVERLVQLGGRAGARVAVLRGLAPGEVVVVQPASALASGARVE